MKVAVTSEHPGGKAVARELAVRARSFLRALGRHDAELSVLLTTDRGIRALNRRWRDIDRATDVLSFPLSEPSGHGPWLGDVVISMDTAVRRARGDRRRLRQELDRYLAHGLLHLLGENHRTPSEARKMARAETRLVRAEGLVGQALRRAAR